jgi:hypothetical protein
MRPISTADFEERDIVHPQLSCLELREASLRSSMDSTARLPQRSWVLNACRAR